MSYHAPDGITATCEVSDMAVTVGVVNHRCNASATVAALDATNSAYSGWRGGDAAALAAGYIEQEIAKTPGLTGRTVRHAWGRHDSLSLHHLADGVQAAVATFRTTASAGGCASV